MLSLDILGIFCSLIYTDRATSGFSLQAFFSNVLMSTVTRNAKITTSVKIHPHFQKYYSYQPSVVTYKTEFSNII
jgi:hypothetical protein